MWPGRCVFSCEASGQVMKTERAANSSSAATCAPPADTRVSPLAVGTTRGIDASIICQLSRTSGPNGTARRFLDIVRLRYSLQWAQIRHSTGRILWFAFVQALMALAAVLFAIFGLGSLIVAVRLGRGESMAQVILAIVYVNALVSSVVFGFGLNQAFSDRSL